MSDSSPRKVAIVTGGARGIGRACALALARAGHAIALVDLLVPEMERTAGEIRAIGQKALIFEADVALFGRPQETAGGVRRGWGRVQFPLKAPRKAPPHRNP